MTPRTRRTLIVLAIVLAGFLVRAAGITGRGYPFTYYDDEASNLEISVRFWDPEKGGFDLNPHDFNKPALGHYLHFGQFGFYYLWGRYVTGEFHDTADFGRTFVVARGPFYAIARFFNCVAGALTIVLVYRIGRSIHGRRTGLLAAFLLAVLPGHVYWSPLVKMDVLATLFAAVSFSWILKIAEKGRWRDYVWAGFFAGLGTATKYTPAMLAVAIAVAHAMRGSAVPAFRPRALLRPMAAALALLAGFFAGSPYNFLDSHWYRHSIKPQLDLVGQMLFFGAGEVGAGDNVFTQAWRLWRVLDDATVAGNFLLIAAASGLVLGLRRGGRVRRGFGLILAACGAFAFILCTANEQYPRANHAVIFHPFLACAAAYALVRASERLPVPRGRQEVVLVVMAALMLMPVSWLPGGGLLAIEHELRLPQPKTAAFRWIQQHVPAGATIINDFEILPLLPDERRVAWILERIEHDIDRSERNLAAGDAPHHWQERLDRYRAYRTKYRLVRDGAARLDERRYDVIVLDKPWQTDERELLESRTWGYNDLWPLIPTTRPEDVPPVERYRLLPSELPSDLDRHARAAHPVLEARPDYLVAHKQSYANYRTPQKREEFPEWAAFYDDLLAHYDAWEFPDPGGGQGLGTVRIFDLRRRTSAPVVTIAEQEGSDG